MKIVVVVATRATKENFFRTTATGKSLAFNRTPDVQICFYPENSKGLSTVYNNAIQRLINDETIFVFAHDDLFILDYFWTWRVKEGLMKFDLIGLAGNKRRVPRQPAWHYVDTEFTPDDARNFSGVVGHGSEFPSRLGVYTPPRQKVKLLDGLFLAIKGSTLRKEKLAFDEQFDFHFYDLDFCRQLETKGLTCGTWDLSVIHQSRGNFRSQNWRDSYQKYIQKWND